MRIHKGAPSDNNTLPSPTFSRRPASTSSPRNLVPSPHMDQSPAPVGRARLSCVPCRKRKSKCDEAQPCSSCVLRGTTSQCALPSTSSAAAAEAMRDADAVRAAAAAGLRVLSGGGPSDSPNTSSSNVATPSTRKKRQRVDDTALQAAAVPSTPLGEIAVIRESLSRLDVMLQSQQTSQALSMLHSSILGGDNLAQFMEPLPPRDDEMLKRLVALLPSRFDCEVLLEFLLQEADWLVSFLSADLVLSIWSRTVYGGRISLAESGTLCTLLTMSSMLLSESPHRYYKTHVAPSALHPPLFQYALDVLESLAQDTPTWDKVVMLTTMAETLKIGGQRSLAYWTTINAQATDVAVEYGLFDESSDIWATFDVEKTELARRIAHVGVLREHWISIHSERATRFSAQDVRVEPAAYDNLGLSKPFVASPDGLPKADETILKSVVAKPIPRLFRHKAPGEAQKSAHFATTAIQQSALIPDISSYLQSVASWTTIAESTPHRGSDDQREELLHLCTALRERIMQFKLWLDSTLAEPKVLRADDVFQCRHAAQATLIHHGLRHMLACCYRPWMANDITTEDPSPLLIETQMHALDLARATVATIPTTRTLLTCGVVPFFASWCAANLYVAATTLAIPLLLSSKRPFPDLDGDGASKQNLAAWPQRNNSGASPASAVSTGSKDESRRSSLLAIHGRAGSPPTPGATHMMAVPPSELRHLASDILYVLDTLSMISSTSPEASPMSKAAQERLMLLVDHYDIRGHSRGEGVHDRSLLPGANASPSSMEGDPSIDPANAAVLLGFTMAGSGVENAPLSTTEASAVVLKMSGAPSLPHAAPGTSHFAPVPNPALPVFDSRGNSQNVFDSILALDDSFWKELLVSGSGGSNGAQA